MNIIRTLDMALPEIRERHAEQVLPRIEPTLVAREHTEEGECKILVLKPKGQGYYRLTPEQWQFLNLFDGKRSFAAIAEKHYEDTGQQCSEEQVGEFADDLAGTDLIYRSALEDNAALLQTLELQRQKRRKSKWLDLSEVNIADWDPDAFFDRLYPHISFFYTPWFNFFSLVMVGIMTAIFVKEWSNIWHDTLEFYNLTNKTFADFLQVWVLFSIVAFFHESAHGCTVKHYGGQVHRMGFMLMYFLPCFFCDSTEVYVYGDKWARIFTALAGIWIELVFCSFATMLWWATSPGMWIHDLAYMLILITGIGVVILNVNPLVKLDGYFIFSELIGIPDIKEKSTSYLSSWYKHHVCGLPVEVDHIPQRRRLLYVTYGLLSGVYCYLLLFVVVEIAYHVAYKFTPEWAWVPALWLAWKVFQSRIKAAWRLMKVMYLDKKERLQAWATPLRLGVVAAAVAFLLFAPVWPDSVEGRFVLEPAQKAIIRAEVPGRVERVLVGEGSLVSAGSPLVQLRNLSLESEAAHVRAELQVATARATQAGLRYASYGAAEREQQRVAKRSRVLADKMTKLLLVSPVGGVVVTPRLEDLTDSYVKEGAAIAEVDDLSSVRARIFVPEVAVRDLRVGASADIKLDSFSRPLAGRVLAIAPATAPLPEGLIPKEKYYQGFRQPQYYAATIELPSHEILRDGMSGSGKIRVGHRSLAGFVGRLLRDSLGRKFW